MLVVSGGQSAPLLVDVEGAFDDVPTFVELDVQRGWSPAGGASVPPVVDLVVTFGDDDLDPARGQLQPVVTGAVGLVRQQRVGPGTGPPTERSGGPQPVEQVGSIGESPACPGPTRTLSGRPAPSTSWWILVDGPPRDRPMP